jgi:hypothetical protein
MFCYNLSMDTEPKMSTRFIGFDEQRYHGSEHRADIVFGPDMFDPRLELDCQPLSEAVARGNSDIDPADFGKTVGEILGENVTLDELTRVSIANARSIRIAEPEPLCKKFFARLFASSR